MEKQEYTVEGKVVTLGEFQDAVPNLMNDTKKINNVKTLELVSITNGLVKDGANKNDIKDALSNVVSEVKSSHNRKIITEIMEALTGKGVWESLTKNM